MIPKDLFTVASLSTMVGLVGLTYVITNGLAQAFGWRQTWLGLVVALFWVEFAVYLATTSRPVDYIIGVANAFLVYLTSSGAAGGARAGIKTTRSRTIRPQNFNSPSLPRFFDRWF